MKVYGLFGLSQEKNPPSRVGELGVEHKVIRRIFRVTDNPEKIVEVELSEVQ